MESKSPEASKTSQADPEMKIDTPKDTEGGTINTPKSPKPEADVKIDPAKTPSDKTIKTPEKPKTDADVKIENLDEPVGKMGDESGSGSNGNSLSPYGQIARLREKAGLQPYSLESGDTVAMVEINGKRYFGVNSTITPQSRNATRELRQKWLNKIQWAPYKEKTPQHLGHAQSLTHAEAHALIRAYERQGSMQSRVTMYVDRKTCNICRGELPALLKTLGIEELEIYSGGSDIPIIITQ